MSGIVLALVSLDTPVVGLARLERLLELWPICEPQVEARYFSSYDRSGGNDDGFSGKYSSLYTDAKGENVIFDVEQPGCLYTLWFTSDSGGHGKLNFGKVRFYFDGEKTPRAEVDANDLFSGRVAPFLKPLVMDNYTSTGGYACYLPMPFSKGLRITTEKRCGFYNAFYHLHPAGTKITSWTGKEDSTKVRGQWESAMKGRPQGLAGKAEKITGLEWSKRGSGVVTRLAFTVDEAWTAEALTKSTLEIQVDGNPTVHMPLGSFFALPLGPASVRSLAVFVDEKKLVSLLPMPFWGKIHITLKTKASVKMEVSVGPNKYDLASAGHFCASWTGLVGTEKDADFEVAEVPEAGKAIGVAQCIEPPTPQDKGWWEGDLRVYVDHALSPAMHGTGHEDDFLGGWSNEFLSTPFTLPMHGEPYVGMIDRTSPYNAEVSLYRFFVGVPYGMGLRWSTEHGTENKHNYNYGGVLYYYVGGARYQPTDEVSLSDPISRDAHNVKFAQVSEVQELVSRFEGRWVGTEVTGSGYSSLGPVEFDLEIDPDNVGVKLRRRFDQFHGRQRARVIVDGKPVGMWYIAEENTVNRWAERDFFIPASFTQGKSTIHITIDPPASSPLFSHSSYSAFSLVP